MADHKKKYTLPESGRSQLFKDLPVGKPVDISEFLKEMKDKVIPDILDAVDERRLAAAKSREWQLKC